MVAPGIGMEMMSMPRFIAALLQMVRPIPSTNWQFYVSPFALDLKMRRRDCSGKWQYRPPTKAEQEQFEAIDAW